MDKAIELYLDIHNQVEIELELQVSQETGVWEEYKGSYNVVPKWNEQVLETKNKVLRDNVTVVEIPKYKTENLGGGYTVTIGGN